MADKYKNAGDGLMNGKFIQAVLGLVFLGLTVGCNGNATSEATSDEEGVCAAVGALDASLDYLGDSESVDEYRERYAAVSEDFAALRSASGGKYAAETDAFETALNEFGSSLASLGDGGLLTGLLDVAGDAAELAAAGDVLDDAIDCPG